MLHSQDYDIILYKGLNIFVCSHRLKCIAQDGLVDSSADEEMKQQGLPVLCTSTLVVSCRDSLTQFLACEGWEYCWIGRQLVYDVQSPERHITSQW